MRITPPFVTKLETDEIFVFGSNESGIHGKGAAHMALRWGAIYGQPEGLQGRTYAIPTKDSNIKKTLNLNKIQKYVNEFIDFAKKNPNLKFLVTEIGCGLAGLSPIDVGPLFINAKFVENIFLPLSFWNEIETMENYKTINDVDMLLSHLGDGMFKDVITFQKLKIEQLQSLINSIENELELGIEPIECNPTLVLNSIKDMINNVPTLKYEGLYSKWTDYES